MSAYVADGAGVSLIELAIAFVVNHPAVTSAIIGPRTMEQLDSQLPAADVSLDAAVLDRIDELVNPGVNLNPPTPATASRSSSRTSAGVSRWDHPPNRAIRSSSAGQTQPQLDGQGDRSAYGTSSARALPMSLTREPGLLSCTPSGERNEVVAKVLLEMSVSLDGYVTGPDVSSAESERFEPDHFSGIGPWGEEPTFHAPAFVATVRPAETIVKPGATSYGEA